MLGKRMILIVLIFVLFVSCIQGSKKRKHIDDKPEMAKTLKLSDSLINQQVNPKVIYRTLDTGKTWSPFANGIPKNATVSGFEIYQDRIYATTDSHGVFFSKNGDNFWEEASNELPEKIDVNCIVSIDSNLVIGTFKQGIFISKDEGLHWEKPKMDIKGTSIRAFLKFNNKLIAGTDNGVYESKDLGESWDHVFGDMQVSGFTRLNNKIYAAVFNGAMVSVDSGLTWEYIYKLDALHDISVDNEYIYIMTLSRGLLKSNNDGLTWRNVNAGMGSLNLYTFEFKNIGQELFAAQWHGIYHFEKKEDQWRLIKGLPKEIAFSTLEVTDFGLLAGVAMRK